MYFVTPYSQCLVIALLNFIYYFKTLRLGIVCDDIPTFNNPPKYKNLLHKWYLQIFGMAKFNIPYDHLITLVVHTVTSIFVYLAFGATTISFYAALLFSINPCNNQGSVWLSGRGYVLPTMFLLMAMTFPMASLLLLACAAFYHPAYLCLIAVIGHTNWWIIAFAPVIWVYHYKRFRGIVEVKRNAETVTEDQIIKPSKLILFVKTYAYYFVHCLWPVRISFYHSYMQSMAGNEIMKKKAYTMKDRYFFIGLAMLATTLYISIYHWGIAAYGLWWFLVCIAPYCNLLRIQQEIAERYMYMASAGLMLTLSSLLSPYPIVIALLMGWYMGRLYHFYTTCYVDDYWLCEASIAECPTSWFSWHIRGHKRISQGALREALNMWVMARMMSPKEFKLLYNIGAVLAIIKKPKEAENHWKAAEKVIVEGQEEMAKDILKNARNGKINFLT